MGYFMYGPIITGIFGKNLHMIDRKILQLPHVGGVILFGQNFSSKQQITTLIHHIQEVRKKHHLQPALILIDHEGGAVQRLNGEQFTPLPSALWIGQLYQKNPQQAVELIRHCALVTAYELHSVGINVCLGPVLDLLKIKTKEEQSRFYSQEPDVIVALSCEFNRTLQQQGILSVAKHFPGIGYTKTNTHYNVSLSESELAALLKEDLLPYRLLQKKNLLPAIMTAHRVFPHVDTQPICTSTKWLNEVLRGQLGYEGLVFTDCVQMVGASIMGGSLQAKIHNSLAAGCDFVMSSQTPFDSYTQLYNTLRSPLIDELLAANRTRNERINLILQSLSSQFLGSLNDYNKAKKNINELQSYSQTTGQNPLTRIKKTPKLYKLKKRIMTQKWLKKYLKNNSLLHQLTLYQFRLRLLVHKLKNHFRK
jgi:beta-N-acetylhexosaminidase